MIIIFKPELPIYTGPLIYPYGLKKSTLNKKNFKSLA